MPISAYCGQNLKDKHNVDWYKGDSLLNELEKIEKKFINDEINKPLRMTIKNKFSKQARRNGYGLTVKIDSGILEKSDKILIMPLDKVSQILAIYQLDKKVEYSICGETVDIILKLKNDEEFDEI